MSDRLGRMFGMRGLTRMAMVAVLAVVFGLAAFVPNAEAVLNYKKGTFNKTTTTGNQSVTGVGFQPKAVIFFHTGQSAEGFAAHIAAGYGFAAYDGTAYGQAAIAAHSGDNSGSPTDGTGYQSATRCIVMIADALNPAATQAEASIVSFDADGFTINWAKNGGATDIIHYVALGGTAITNAKVGTYAGPASLGNNAVTGVGFQPDAVLFATNNRSLTLDTFAADSRGSLNIGFMVGGATPSQGSTGFGVRGAQTAADHASVINSTTALSVIRGNALDYSATYVSMDADGFTINASVAQTGRQLHYLALKGGRYKVGVFAQPTSGTPPFNSSVTGVGFQPAGLLLTSSNSSATDGTVQTANPAASFMIGAGNSGTAEGVIWGHNTGFNPNDANESTVTTAILRHAQSTNTISTEADLFSFDADGFTLTYTARADTTARRTIYFAFGSLDTTAPIPGTVTVSPESGSYVPAAFTITTQFTDAESAVTSCQYTLNNGGAWSAGTVSGTGPYTCAASVAGQVNGAALAINMRATSTGGTGTATKIDRTVDAAGPTDGTLTPTAGNAQVVLNWTAATDAASGLRGTDTYKLVSGNAGAGVPADCNSGTQVYLGTLLTATATGLTNGSTYGFRVCAYDAIGNPSVGATASATPTSCVENKSVTLGAIPDPITGATSITASSPNGATNIKVGTVAAPTNDSPWTYTPPVNSTGSVTFYATATGDCGTISASPVTVTYDTRPGTAVGTAAAVGADERILVTAPYLGDANANNTLTVKWVLAGGNFATPLGTQNLIHAASPYNYTITGLTNGTAYDVQVTYADADGIISGTAVQTITNVIPLNLMMHNSQVTGSTKWPIAQSGKTADGWGITGGKYGKFTCATCHVKNATPNIKRIRQTIAAPDATPSNFPGSGQTVTLTTVDQVANPTFVGYGDDTGGHVSSNKVCEVCHTITRVHRYNTNVDPDGTGPLTAQTDLGHYNGKDCIGCHKHQGGFKASCAACHGNPPETGKLVTTRPTGSLTAGAHLAHNSTLAIACAQCHYGSVGSGAKHDIDGTVTLGFVNLPTGIGGSNAGSYTGQDVGGGKVKYDSSDVGTTVKNSPEAGFGTKTCANYCHGSTIVDGSAKNPVWDGASPIACGTCHRGSNTAMDNASALGSHRTHAGATKRNLACTACHGAAAGSLKIAGAGATNHVNGAVTWDVTGLAKHYSSAANPDYKAAATGSTGALAPTAPASYGTCRNLACHWGTETPKWGVGPATCTTCHNNGTNDGQLRNSAPASGSHAVHVGANSVYVDCDDCHGAGAITGTHTGHLNNGTNFAGKLVPGTNFTDVGGRANTADTCAVICHQSGTWGGTLNWTAGVTGNCIDCHSNLFHTSGNAGPVVVTGVAADTTGGTGSHMKSLPSQSLPTTAADWTTRCQLCHDKHSGTISIPLPSTDTLKTALGINYPGAGHGAIKLRAIGGSTTEAQTCWNCHDTATTTDKTLSGVNVTFTNPATIGATNIGTKFAVGDWITITGSSSAANNRTFKVATSSANSITVTIPAGAASLTSVASAAGVTIVSPVSEWGVNENAATGGIDYDYGYLYTSATMPGAMTSNWTSAVWRSGKGRLSGTGYGAYNPFVYKQGSIQSTHTANPAVTDIALTGSAYNYTGTPNSVGEIRCTYCHDVHDLNKATGDATTGAPFLRGSWKGNPYPEDGAPRWGMLNFTADALSSNTSDYSYSFGRVPRGSASATNSGLTTVPKAGGWWIDQNSGNPNYVSGAYQTATATSGLCALCHGSDSNAIWTSAELGAIDQKSGENLWVSGFNGHANVVLGGPGRGANATAATDESARRNIFTRTLRGSATRVSGQFNGPPATPPNAYVDMGLATNASEEGYSYRSAETDGYLAYPRVGTTAGAAPIAALRSYAFRTFVWGAALPYNYQRTVPTSAIAANTAQLQVSDLSAPGTSGASMTESSFYNAQANYHTFTCSKCHNPHASRLPKLMITNCLDTNHNDWDNYQFTSGSTYQYGVSYTTTNGTTTRAWPSVWAGSRTSQHAAAQNCHRLDDRAPVNGTITRGPGWNTVTPWDQYATPDNVISTNPNP